MSIDDAFIDRVLDGTVSESEVADFQRWLQDPDNLERFAHRSELHVDLRRSLRRRQLQEQALHASVESTSASPTESRQDHSPLTFRSRRILAPAVTTLVTAACLFIGFMLLETKPYGNDEDTASVVSTVNGLLIKKGSAWNDDTLPVGTYELRQGLLNLQFGGGVMVYVEAPAHFDTVSNKRIVLHSGRLSATVPPAGIGFTVETPEAEVVDFGTEFSIDVEGGTSEVHVFDGLVRVSPGESKQRDVSRSVELHASQAVRITDGATELQDISLATNRFIRNFDEPKRSYTRALKSLSPLVFYRMPIRDQGLVSQPPEYSGVVLTGQGKRPPHARGVFVGGSLRVGADSTGRGGRVDAPPPLNTGQFSLTLFVYWEPATHEPFIAEHQSAIATNLHHGQGNFSLNLDQHGMLQATIKSSTGQMTSVTGDSALTPESWRQIVVTADGQQLRLYEDGNLVAAQSCTEPAVSGAQTIWFGITPQATRMWNGRIDEVGLFDRPLSAKEVAALYRTAQEEIARSK